MRAKYRNIWIGAETSQKL